MPWSISCGLGLKVPHGYKVMNCCVYCRYSVLENYLFVGRNGGTLLALGAASLFNHSKQPNFNYTIDHKQLVIRFRAARDIAPNEELTITYGSDSKLWFNNMSVISAESSVSMLHDYLDDESLLLAGLQIWFITMCECYLLHLCQKFYIYIISGSWCLGPLTSQDWKEVRFLLMLCVPHTMYICVPNCVLYQHHKFPSLWLLTKVLH